MCRIGSDAAKDELEGQRSCRGGRFAVRPAETNATRLTAAAEPEYRQDFGCVWRGEVWPAAGPGFTSALAAGSI